MKNKKSVALIGFSTTLNDYFGEKLRRNGILDIKTYEYPHFHNNEDIQLVHFSQMSELKNPNAFIIGPRSISFEASMKVSLSNIIELPFLMDDLLKKIA